MEGTLVIQEVAAFPFTRGVSGASRGTPHAPIPSPRSGGEVRSGAGPGCGCRGAQRTGALLRALSATCSLQWPGRPPAYLEQKHSKSLRDMTLRLLRNIGGSISAATKDSRELPWLRQRISIATIHTEFCRYTGHRQLIRLAAPWMSSRSVRADR